MKNFRSQIQCIAWCLIALLSFIQPANVAQAANATQATQAANTPKDEQTLLNAMQSRLDTLMALKLSGDVGESNMGLLEAREVLEREHRRLSADENQDRLAYYKLTADKLGVPVAAVQRKRAEQIRENSPKGIWLESKAGVWYRE